MSADIKPGNTIVTIQDAPTLLGYTVPKGTPGTVMRSGPPIVGPYSVYAWFEGDTPGSGRQVRPGDVVVTPASSDTEITLQLNDAVIVRHTTDPDLLDLYDMGWVKVSPQPAQGGDNDGRETAPLDPSKVRVGDMVTMENGETTVRGPVAHIEKALPMDVVLGFSIHNVGWRYIAPGVVAQQEHGVWTLTAHQPTPEPEWKPGTTGSAHVVSGDATGLEGRTFRKVRGMVVHRPAPIDDDMFCTTEGELWALEGRYCNNFVPDEARPTRDALTAALQETAQERETRSSFAEDADLILAALLRGESR